MLNEKELEKVLNYISGNDDKQKQEYTEVEDEEVTEVSEPINIAKKIYTDSAERGVVLGDIERRIKDTYTAMENGEISTDLGNEIIADLQDQGAEINNDYFDELGRQREENAAKMETMEGRELEK